MRPSTENPACRTLLLLVCASRIPSHTRVLRMPPEEDEGEGCSTGSVLYCTGSEPTVGASGLPLLLTAPGTGRPSSRPSSA